MPSKPRNPEFDPMIVNPRTAKAILNAFPSFFSAENQQRATEFVEKVKQTPWHKEIMRKAQEIDERTHNQP